MHFMQQFDDILRNTRILSPTRAWCFGQEHRLPSKLRMALDSRAVSAHLRFVLQETLYSSFYVQGGRRIGRLRAAWSTSDQERFERRLSEANASRGYWSGGWIRQTHEEDGCTVRRDGLSVRVGSNKLREVGYAGDSVDVQMPSELTAMSPGFFLASGDTSQILDSAQQVRVYWNVTARGAVQLLRFLSCRLNESGIAFRLKILKDLACFRRCDAAVLYLGVSEFPASIPSLVCAYENVKDQILPLQPAFTLPLERGVSIAHNPTHQDESFGQSRCRLVAQALVEAGVQHGADGNSRLAYIERSFAAERIELAKPYESRDSHICDTAVDLWHGQRARKRCAEAPLRKQDPQEGGLLEAASGIASYLADTAIWCNGRCNWLGPEALADRPTSQRLEILFQPLSGDLYDGSAGVAVFLADLSTVTGDESARATAIGAIHDSLAWAGAMGQERGGLYTGAWSVAMASTYVGLRLGDPYICRLASELAGGLASDTGDDLPPYDLLSGLAGRVIVLLSLWNHDGGDELLHRARRIGDTLLDRADRSATGTSWRSSAVPGGPNLLGFSHGAAGIAYALAELFANTGESSYLRAALDAFEYEREWFDEEQSNWPTLLDPLTLRRLNRAHVRTSCSTYWCHGAPGIAISRMRASEIIDDATIRSEAFIALAATRCWARDLEDIRLENFSLCHGWAGNAAILASGAQRFPELGSEWRKAGLEILHAGIATAEDPTQWLCGTHSLSAPGLMVGLAGIGQCLLSFARPSVPSMLEVQPMRIFSPLER
jgi:Lanthionine synthetase C-like protein/HopA1 effector protein family